MNHQIGKIEIPLSEDVREELDRLQARVGLQSLEDLTVHAWEVLRFILQTGNRQHSTISSGDMEWIAHPGKGKPPTELFKNLREKFGAKPIPFNKIDTQILKEIHRLLDDECIDEAIKASQIYKLLKSNSHRRKDAVTSEMLLSAAETFANESDPEKATQLITEASHKHSHIPPPSG